MDHALLMRVLHGLADRTNSASRSSMPSRCWSQYFVSGMPGTYSIAKYGRPSSVVPASTMCAMLRMAHHRERLALQLEARDDLARVRCRP